MHKGWGKGHDIATNPSVSTGDIRFEHSVMSIGCRKDLIAMMH